MSKCPVACSVRHVAYALILFLAAFNSVSAQTTSWISFSPAQGDFTVSVPVVLHPTEKNKNLFQAVADGHTYSLGGCKISKQERTECSSFLAGIKDQGWNLESTNLAKGNGWTGKIYTFTGNGKNRATALYAVVNGADIAYCLSVDASSEEAKKFIGTFAVDPQKAAQVHSNDPTPGFNPVAYEIGRYIGFCLPLIILFVFLWRSSRKKQTLMSSDR